jgi:hypothetical protein
MRLLPLLLLLLVLVLGVVGVVALAVRRPFQDRPATVADARRHARRISIAAVLIGALGALAVGFAGAIPWSNETSMVGRPGVAAISMPLAFGLAHTGSLLVGEVTWPKPAGNVRRARLVRRGLWDSVPRWLLRLAEVTLAIGFASVVVGALLAHPDGRTITVSTAGGRAQGAAAPFAGIDYGVPTVAGLAILAVITGLALWVVTERPALGTADEQAEAALRRASAHRVLRGATTAALLTVGGLLTVSGFSLRSAATDAVQTARSNDLTAGILAQALPWLGWLLALLGLLGMLIGAGLLLVRAPQPATDTLTPVGP